MITRVHPSASTWARRFLVLALGSIVCLAASAGRAQDEDSSQIRVAAAAICLGVEDHEPVAPADTFRVDVGRLYCWTRVENGAGQTIVHAWIHDGTTRARVELPVGSASWRTFSSKGLLPGWTGDWQVKVMTPDGAVLQTIPFVVTRGQP
jgi:hypothetical protein